MEAKYRYYLLSNDSEGPENAVELRDAPIGWDSTKFRLVRDLTYIGVLKNISVEFEFVGDGFRFMQRQRLLYGVDADVLIRIYKRNPNEFLFEGKVNMENFSEDRKFNKFKVDIIQSSFVQRFQNREDVVLNVFNSISLDRAAIDPAELHEATIRGRSIEFSSQFEGSLTSEPDIYSTTIPFLIKENGNEDVNTSSYVLAPSPATTEEIREILYSADGSIYINRLVSTQTISIAFNSSISIAYLGEPLPILLFGIGDLMFYLGYKIVFRIALVNEDGELVEILYEQSFTEVQGNFNLSYNDTIDVPVGHRVVFACERWSIQYVYDDGDLEDTIELEYVLDGGDAGDVSGTRMRTEVTYNTLNLTITTNSVVPDSDHPVLLPHELFSNLIGQINGGTLYSEVFGREELGYDQDGEFAYLAITTGELLRGIPPDEVQLSTSLREAFSSYSSVICLGAIITGNQIRIDPLDVLFNNEIAAEIGEVKELAISPTKEFLFNSVKCGYPKNEYEEQNGRDEFNTTYQYTNSIQAVKKELDLVSKYYGDGYGIEFARRESIITTGTKDTKYDDKIFFIDLIKITEMEDFGVLDSVLDVELGVTVGTLRSRRQEGILFVDGIFSPDTAMNLRIAAGQNMLRWQKFLNIPLHRKDKEYYFQSKDKNAGLQLVTALGETIDGQNLNTGSVSYFLPEYRVFKCPVTIDLLFAILANPLGLVNYTYESETFFDYLFEVDAETDKGIAEWRMLGTKNTPVQVEQEPGTLGDFLKYGDGFEDLFKHNDGVDDFILYQ